MSVEAPIGVDAWSETQLPMYRSRGSVILILSLSTDEAKAKSISCLKKDTQFNIVQSKTVEKLIEYLVEGPFEVSFVLLYFDNSVVGVETLTKILSKYPKRRQLCPFIAVAGSLLYSETSRLLINKAGYAELLDTVDSTRLLGLVSRHGFISVNEENEQTSTAPAAVEVIPKGQFEILNIDVLLGLGLDLEMIESTIQQLAVSAPRCLADVQSVLSLSGNLADVNWAALVQPLHSAAAMCGAEAIAKSCQVILETVEKAAWDDLPANVASFAHEVDLFEKLVVTTVPESDTPEADLVLQACINEVKEAHSPHIVFREETKHTRLFLAWMQAETQGLLSDLRSVLSERAHSRKSFSERRLQRLAGNALKTIFRFRFPLNVVSLLRSLTQLMEEKWPNCSSKEITGSLLFLRVFLPVLIQTLGSGQNTGRLMRLIQSVANPSSISSDFVHTYRPEYEHFIERVLSSTPSGSPSSSMDLSLSFSSFSLESARSASSSETEEGATALSHSRSRSSRQVRKDDVPLRQVRSLSAIDSSSEDTRSESARSESGTRHRPKRH